MESTAIANANIALIKYWGKTDREANIPAVGSLSLTLSHLWTRTTVAFRPALKNDRLFLNGRPAGQQNLERVVRFIDEVRLRCQTGHRCEINSINSFPTAAGLASSASGYAALAMAATHAAGCPLSLEETSSLARLGSGSAARSVFGGFVELPAGETARPPVAVQIADENFWPLAVLVAVTDDAPKFISSRAAMEVTQRKSPFYDAWVKASVNDLENMRSALQRRDFEVVGALAEHSALKLHGLMMSSRPGLLYWNAGTMAVIQEILKMRKDGLAVYFTIDAGPQVKALCRREEQAAVADRLLALPGVRNLILAGPGPSARIEEQS